MANHFTDFDVYDVPPEYRPLGAWAYFGYTILFNLPVIGLIFLIVFSLSDSNLNRRNFARSYFIALVFLLILFLILFVTGQLGSFIDAVNSGELQSGGWFPFA